jgi:thiol:disulfide interchange protein
MPLSSETISTRQEFSTLLQKNTSIVILKFGASWCGPCQVIENAVHSYISSMPIGIQCIVLDVDECFDLYAYLKSKKIVQGIPCLLAYYAGNTHYAPDEFMKGADLNELKIFFDTCLRQYQSMSSE